ncbi:MAG TPA: GAF domain-containing protein [Verrucomicrobiae bacterium]|nr:GAF domain-containing protein [Verrucomicrobiae bacterium]
MNMSVERSSVQVSAFRDSVLQILDAAIELDGASKGTVQLFDPEIDALHIVGQRGFDPAFLELFEIVRPDDLCICGRSLRHKRRVMCHDIMADRLFSPYFSTVSANGIRAVQSTPVIGADGRARGVISTHFSKVHILTQSAGKVLDGFASEMAALFAEYYPEQFRS